MIILDKYAKARYVEERKSKKVVKKETAKKTKEAKKETPKSK